MKNAILITVLALFTYTSYGQNFTADVTKKNVQFTVIEKETPLHFISPEEIKYADISSNDVTADMPEKKILRLKTNKNLHYGDSFLVTIVTESFVATYSLTVAQDYNGSTSYLIAIDPSKALQLAGTHLSEKDYYNLAMRSFSSHRRINNVKTKAYDLKFWINNIYIAGDLVILDLSAKNKSNLKFDIDEIRFKIINAKELKATVNQDIELKPLYSLYKKAENSSITDSWRNIYIFRKFSYPTQKHLAIEMTEQQISGRQLVLEVNYNQILQSQFLN